MHSIQMLLKIPVDRYCFEALPVPFFFKQRSSLNAQMTEP